MIKSYLKALIASTTTRPANKDASQVTLVADGTNRSFVTPADGFVSVHTDTPTDDKQSNVIWSGNLKNPVAGVATSASGGREMFSLGFFRKGEIVNYNINGFTRAVARIYECIGGGKFLNRLEVSYA